MDKCKNKKALKKLAKQKEFSDIVLYNVILLNYRIGRGSLYRLSIKVNHR